MVRGTLTLISCHYNVYSSYWAIIISKLLLDSICIFVKDICTIDTFDMGPIWMFYIMIHIQTTFLYYYITVLFIWKCAEQQRVIHLEYCLLINSEQFENANGLLFITKDVLSCHTCMCHHILAQLVLLTQHDDVIKWKHFPRYWPFVRGIHRSPVNSPHKGQ